MNTDDAPEQPEQTLPLMNRIRVVGCGERRAVELMIETPIREEKRLSVLQYRLMIVARSIEEDTQRASPKVIEKEHEAIMEAMKPPEEKSNIIRPNGFHP